MTDDEDFFDVVQAPSPYGLTPDKSRYRYPAPPDWTGAPPKPSEANPLGLPSWRRMTNLVGAFSDQRALQIWMDWMAWMGLRANDGLIFDEWMAEHVDDLSPEDQKALVTRYAKVARETAGAEAGARRGTARHTMLEGYLATGQVNGTRTMKRQMDDLLRVLDAHELEMIPGWSERRVWHPGAGGIMGTLDVGVMCRRTGQLGIMDLKTQKRFFTYQEAAAQQYGYDSAPWVWNESTAEWVPPLPWTLAGHPDGEYPGQRVALLAHMPADLSPVRLVEVSLDYGREVFYCAARCVELRSVGKSVKPGRRPGAERPLHSRSIVQ